MILGIGIDSVEVKRFAAWSGKTLPQLKKIFSEAEIIYCLQNKRLSAQRFAVRFAAREAFFKALCSMSPDVIIPFLTLCKAVHVVHDDNKIPHLNIDWALLHTSNKNMTSENIRAHVSLTHSAITATAIVILEKC